MMELSIVRGDDPSTLLTTMLKGIETEIGEIGRFKMIINAKDTAHGFLLSQPSNKFEVFSFELIL
jgi:hypothetical protein